jgi:hypothetical protein
MKQQLEKQQLEKQKKFKEYIQNKNIQNKNTQTETKNSPEIPPTPNVSPEIPPTPFHCPSESPKQNKPKISLVSQMDKFFIEPVSKQKIKETRKETRKDIPTSMLPKITNAWKQGPPSIKKEFDLRVFITVSRNDTNRTETEDHREQFVGQNRRAELVSARSPTHWRSLCDRKARLPSDVSSLDEDF